MRLLLLEDETQLRMAVAQGLREEGYLVDECATNRVGWGYAYLHNQPVYPILPRATACAVRLVWFSSLAFGCS